MRLPAQVFAFIPVLYLDEKRRDFGRFDLACCFEVGTGIICYRPFLSTSARWELL